MRPGDEVLGCRVESVGPVRDGIGRARVTDAAGAPKDLLWVVAPEAPLQDRFLAAHRALAASEVPGVVRAERVEAGPLVAVLRAPTSDATLGRLLGPVEPGLVAAIGAAALPALLGGWPTRRLSPEDLALDADGAPVLAPRFGRDDRTGDPIADLAALLGRWWCGQTLAPGELPGHRAPALDPRCDDVVLALRSDPPAALPVLRALAPPAPDLRPALAAGPSAIAVRVTRAEPPEVPADPSRAVVAVRVATWGTAGVVWATSLAAALSVVLLPLAALGLVIGAAIAVGGELVVRQASRPALVDRTAGGRLTEARRAVDEARTALRAAGLPEVAAADVRDLLRAWERELDDFAEGGGPGRDEEARALTARIGRECHQLRALVGRLATDDDAAGPELARWVKTGAP